MRETRNLTGTFAAIAICLLGMTVCATWRWQPSAQSVPGKSISQSPTSSQGAVAFAPAEQRQEGADEGPAIEAPAIEVSETTDEAAGSKATEPSRRPAKELADFNAPYRHARPAPPVADRIVLDPALAELPSLPSIEPSLRSESTRNEVPTSRSLDDPVDQGPTGKLARQGISQSPDIATSWPFPAKMVASLEPLAADPTTKQWSDRLHARLNELHALETLGDPQACVVLEELQRLTHEGMAISSRLSDLNQQAAVMRIAYALQRRLAIWQPVAQLTVPKVTQVSLRDHDSSHLTRKLQAVEERLTRLNNTPAWREYLLLDQLTNIALQQWSTSSGERSELAREFLQRLESANATPEQEAFFAHSDWQEFASEMRQWVCEPVDYAVLLDDLERIETNSDEGASRDVADHYQVMRWSSNASIAELGERINTYYRNANVRIAVSGDLLNRLLPHPETVNENVNDQLMGGRVYGRSRISTRLRLVLLPDGERWRMGLEARGNVDSETETKRGPARFHNAGRSRYLARKILLIDQRGVHTEDAEAAATSNADLTRMETDLDGVPLVNLLVRSIAKQQYDRQAGEAVDEAEGLLATKAESRLDEEVDQQLSDATNKFRKKIWRPLQTLGLCPEAVDMQTTEDRLIARYRLASLDQVGAFTPRPQAPSSSLLSIQVHESVLNNVVASLKLGGREAGLRELFTEVATKLQRKDFQVPEDVPEDVTIELAEQDPIRFECEGDRIHVTLRIAKLASGDGHNWTDFEVCGMYVPDIDGIHIGLERDSYIRLKGNRRRLPMRDQIALRGIFARVMAQHPSLDLLGNVLVSDSRLHDLRVIQFVIRDGWIGIAVGVGDPVKMHLADDPEQPVKR